MFRFEDTIDIIADFKQSDLCGCMLEQSFYLTGN